MTYDFDKAIDRHGTYSMKYDDDGYFHAMSSDIYLDQNTLRLMIADTDFQCAPAITKAMHRVADFPTFGYTTAEAAPEYKDSIISWYQRRFGYEIKPEWIIHASGALDGVGQTIKAFSNPGDGVIICCPVYSNFTSTIHRLHRKVVNCQLVGGENGNYRMDWGNFEKTCADEKNKVYVLCSPENPIGRVWTKDELRKMAEICRAHNVVLVSDEIHCDIVRKGVHHLPILKAVENHSNLIMVSGVNKSFNLMGLQCAYTVIPDDKLRETYSKDYYPEPPTPFAIAGVIAAYNESEDWLDALNQYIDEAFVSVAAYFKKKLPKVKVYVPEGTYTMWVDFTEYGYSQSVLQYLINHKANVCVQGGTSHDPQNGDHFLRFAIACPKAKIFEAIDRIATAFDEYEKSEER